MVTPDNASLALTKFERWPPPAAFKSENNKEVFKSVTRLGPTDAYKSAYKRWNAEIHALPGTTLAATFTVDGKMVVGIGAENILESSVTMNRVWGMPIMPGSSLKGLASHYARSVLAAPKGPIDDKQFIDLFGTTEDAGYLTWLDAWYVPEPMTRAPFTLDVVTPHHGSYYQDDPHDVQNPPWDFEDPKPSYFVSVRGTFLVAVHVVDSAHVEAVEQKWVKGAMNILERALAEWGIGAKTNASYGRLHKRKDISPWVIVEQTKAVAQAAAAADAQGQQDAIEAANLGHQALLAELGDTTRPVERQMERWLDVWSKIEDPAERTRVGETMLRRLRSKPSEFHRVTGRVVSEVSHRQPHDPPGYMVPFLSEMKSWLDEHAPQGLPS